MIYVDDLIGVPYKINGRTKLGLDCIGLVIEVEKRLGHEIPDSELYKKSSSMLEFDILSQQTAEKISKVKLVDKPAKEGDVIIFENSSGLLHHIAVYLGNNQFIHCNKYGVHIEKLNLFGERIGRVYTWL